MSFLSSLRFSALPLLLLCQATSTSFFRSAGQATVVDPLLLRSGGLHWTGGDTPIKVGGGSMTFHSKAKWRNEGIVSETDCTSIAKAPSYNIVLQDQAESTTPVSGAWTVTFYNFHLKRPGVPGKEGVAMTVNPNAGCAGEPNLEAVTITTFHKNPIVRGHVNFYPNGGLVAAGYISSRRYHNDVKQNEYDCSADRDSCERLAFVSINSAAPISCSTPECTVLIKIPD